MDEPRGVGDGEESPPGQASAATAPATGVQLQSQQDQSAWQPNTEYMKVLVSMGISKIAAEKALFYTGNSSADLAAAWIFEHPGADLETPLEDEADDLSSDDIEDGSMEAYKMVFVVNMELEMGTGKVAAQVAHATLGLHRLLLQGEEKFANMLVQWEEYGETKIVLRASNTQHLKDLQKAAISLGLPTYLVQDAGRTQVPAGSTTVLSIMGRIDIVDKVTGSLRLL